MSISSSAKFPSLNVLPRPPSDYSPTIFRSIGITGTSTSLLTTGVFGIIKTIGAVIWILFFIDHFGRRIILMTGATGGAISMFWIGAYIKIADVKHKHATDGLKGGGISALVAFYLWTIFYSTSWNGTPWVYVAITHLTTTSLF